MTDEHLIEEEFEVTNSLGLHARPAALLVETASAFESDILIDRDGVSVDAKSVMSVLMLAAEQGSKIKMTFKGRDAQDAHKAISKLFEIGFNEE